MSTRGMLVVMVGIALLGTPRAQAQSPAPGMDFGSLLDLRLERAQGRSPPVVVRADGKDVKAFSFTVKGGKPVPAARSALDTPRTEFLTPRRIEQTLLRQRLALRHA